MKAEISPHFQTRSPSPIREAQLLFDRRPDRDQIRVINLAIGNVSRSLHPVMQERLQRMGSAGGRFAEGVVGYTESAGDPEARAAFLKIIESCECATEDLHCLVTDGGSQAMELMLLGVCGPASDRPLLLIEPAYTNYRDMARRIAVPTVSIRRQLNRDGTFSRLDPEELNRAIVEHAPRAVLIIPADNPTGRSMDLAEIETVARMAVEHGMWLVSDEAYRQLQYDKNGVATIWALDDRRVEGIEGRRISIESASKVWNACGLRVGALVTDNETFHRQAVSEQTANLSANALGQHLFGALAHLTREQLHSWYESQRGHYDSLMQTVTRGLRDALPGIIVSEPEAALYSVLDVREIAPEEFDATAFIRWCAEQGRIEINGQAHTLLLSPMSGFYSGAASGRSQMRLAYVAGQEEMSRVPGLFRELFAGYLEQAHARPATTV